MMREGFDANRSPHFMPARVYWAASGPTIWVGNSAQAVAALDQLKARSFWKITVAVQVLQPKTMFRKPQHRESLAPR